MSFTILGPTNIGKSVVLARIGSNIFILGYPSIILLTEVQPISLVSRLLGAWDDTPSGIADNRTLSSVRGIF